VSRIRAEYKRETKSGAIFNRERRMQCRNLILKNLPGLIKALEDPAGRADVDDVFSNGLVDVPGYPEERFKAEEHGPFSAGVLLKALRVLQYHHSYFEPWPERAYSAVFDWEGNNNGGGERLSTERQRNAVVALVKLLDNHDGLKRLDVRVTSYLDNPGFALLRQLTGLVFGQELGDAMLQSLVKSVNR
jgi:hypothetical protein